MGDPMLSSALDSKYVTVAPQLSEAVRVGAVGTASYRTTSSWGSASLNVGAYKKRAADKFEIEPCQNSFHNKIPNSQNAWGAYLAPSKEEEGKQNQVSASREVLSSGHA